jgi:tetratricopeptide (TPR) repeat protein
VEALEAEMNRTIGACLLCLAVAALACGAWAQVEPASEESFANHLKAGTEEASRGDISAALADIHAAIALDPNRSDGWYELGSLLGQAGDFQAAEAALRRAILLKPDLAKAHYSLALTLIGNPQGKMDWAGAMAECDEALKYQPDYAQALNLLGAGLSATGKPDAAIPVLEHAIQLSPGLPEAHFNLALALESKDQLDEALKEYRAALAARSAYPEAISALGNLLLRMGKTAEAEKELDQALRLNPDLTAAHYAMARVLRSLGHKSEAAVEFNETKDLTDRPSNGIQSSQMSNQSLEMASKGDLAGAASLLRKAIALKPDYGVPHFNLGLILADSGDTTGALEELVKAISLLPGQPKPWFEYGRVLVRAKDYRGGRAALAWAAKLAPSDAAIRNELASVEALQPSGGADSAAESDTKQPQAGAVLDDAADHLAFALELKGNGDFEGAAGELLRCLALQPAAIEPRRNLAEAYARLGDNGHAILEYYKVIRLEPGDVGSHLALGNILAAQGDTEEALNQFRAALSFRPDSAEVRSAIDKAQKALSGHL